MHKLYKFSLLVLIFICGLTLMAFRTQAADHPWYSGEFNRHQYRFYSATLLIDNVTNERFNFKLHALSGANMGGVKGVAYINDNQATFDDNKGGVLTFNINKDSITITQSNKMHNYGGMGVFFEGQYDDIRNIVPQAETTDYLTECKIFQGEQEAEFILLVGDNYKKFTNTANLLFDEPDLDDSNARVTRMGVRGLFRFMESIIMVRDSDNTIWAAVVDGRRVLYFTNSNDMQQIPRTIINWHKHLKNMPIVVMKQ